jgi:hypothetical protein
MTWFKVDDGFWSHEKVIELSPSAGWLWTRAGSYCAHQLTDGAVKRSVLVLLGSSSHVANELVEAGLWDAVDGGYAFHDWDKYQPTRDEVESKREAWKERQRKARASHKSPGESPRDTQGDSRLESTSPVPSRPVPSSSSTKKRDTASRGSRLDPSWLPSAEDVAKIRSECPGVDAQREHAAFVDYWIAQPGQRGVKVDWSATWRNWMRRKADDLSTKRGKPSKDERALDVLELGRRMQEEDDRKAIGA